LLARRGRLRSAGDNKVTGREGDMVFRFGQAEVNFDTYQVTVAGENIRLTTLELKLLRYFIEHEGSVVTRGQLLEDVWGQPQSITTRTVDNFIVNLRKYFEADPARPRHFLSVRGAGYRFVANGEATD
jgi:two-component system OmpR family response regulator